MSVRLFFLFLVGSLSLVVSCGSKTFVQVGEAGLETPGPQRGAGVLSDGVRSFQFYENSDSHVVSDIDIDMNGVPDKVISSAQNKGDELIFLKNINGDYRAVLVSKNLAEDGGRVFRRINQEGGAGGEVMSIETFFPKGADTATHYVLYSGGEWVLSRTIYVVSDWRSRDGHAHYCEVVQNVPMSELALEEGATKVRQVPAESDRDQVCTRKIMPEA